jgi:hypothetical protein
MLNKPSWLYSHSFNRNVSQQTCSLSISVNDFRFLALLWFSLLQHVSSRARQPHYPDITHLCSEMVLNLHATVVPKDKLLCVNIRLLNEKLRNNFNTKHPHWTADYKNILILISSTVRFNTLFLKYVFWLLISAHKSHHQAITEIISWKILYVL